MFHSTIVVGGGQAGLALGYYLMQLRDDFLILDGAQEIGESWRARFDSLVLFTPRQYDSLPGVPFPGPADTYPTKNEVADYLVHYAEHLRLPVQLRTKVVRVARVTSGFLVQTTRGVFTAHRVVIAVGALQCPVIPPFASTLSAEVFQIHSAYYRNPQQLRLGESLVVGAGNSGIQIAAEIGRDRRVYLAIGKRPWCVPQRFLGRDIFWWLTQLGMMDAIRGSWPWGRRIQASNPIIGLTLGQIKRSGNIVCTPRVISTAGDQVNFADGTKKRVANVVWATGYRHDFSWIDAPILDSRGELVHERGITSVPGLFFLGLRWLYFGASGFLGFVARDALYLATQMNSTRAPQLVMSRRQR